MKTTLIGAVVLSSLSFAFSSDVFAKTVKIDKEKSRVLWVGKKVTGQHNGTLALKAGEVDVDGGKLKGGRFQFDMASIKVEDLKDAEYNKKLTDHLRSDDFFSVEKHPTSTFVVTSVKELKGSRDATHEITGDLTIKGIKHPITFPAKIKITKDEATAKGKAQVDRTKYDIRYGSGKFFKGLGDKMINDNFEIELDIATKI